MKLSILDFDQTISINHTFARRCLDRMQNQDGWNAAQRMTQGYADAETNMKAGIPFRFCDDEMFSIATYHNNPDYIMGYLSRMLGKKITACETKVDDVHGIAIRECIVEGFDKPLLISYLPKLGDEFQATMDKLQGKNEQIAHIRSVLEAAGHLSADDVCDFYDDTDRHIQTLAHGRVMNITGHQVSHSAHFEVLTVRAASIPPLVQAVSSQMASAHIVDVPQATSAMIARVTMQDLMATGLVKATTREQLSRAVLTHSVLRTSSRDGDLAITTPDKKHYLVSDDMVRNPEAYQTLERALQHLKNSYGVNIEGAIMPSVVVQQEARPVTEDDIRAWGLVQNVNADEAYELAMTTRKSIIRPASVGGLAITYPNKAKGLLKVDMQKNPQCYVTKDRALNRLAALGVDVSAVQSAAVSAVGMFGDSARTASRAAAKPKDDLTKGLQAQK